MKKVGVACKIHGGRDCWKNPLLQNKWLWRVVKDGHLLYGPNLISDIFPGIPEKIDAAVEIHGQIWIFAGVSIFRGVIHKTMWKIFRKTILDFLREASSAWT